MDSTVAKSYGGFGLGLHIARDLVRAHGGHITVESTMQKGTTFTFTLPSTDAPPQAHDRPAMTQHASAAGKHGQHVAQDGAAQRSAHAERREPGQQHSPVPARPQSRTEQKRPQAQRAHRQQGRHAQHGDSRSAPAQQHSASRWYTQAQQGHAAVRQPAAIPDSTDACALQGDRAAARTRSSALSSSHCTITSSSGTSHPGAVQHLDALSAGACAAQNVLSGACVARSRAHTATHAQQLLPMPAASLPSVRLQAPAAQQLRQRRRAAAPDPHHQSAAQQRLQAWLSASGDAAHLAGKHDPFAEGAMSLQAQQSALLATQGDAQPPALVPGSICDRFRHCTFPQLAQSAPALGLQRAAVGGCTTAGMVPPGSQSSDLSRMAISAPMLSGSSPVCGPQGQAAQQVNVPSDPPRSVQHNVYQVRHAP